ERADGSGRRRGGGRLLPRAVVAPRQRGGRVAGRRAEGRMSDGAHYRFPPGEAYRLNRCLYALRSDRAFAERVAADAPEATDSMGLTAGERADLLPLDRDALVARGA